MINEVETSATASQSHLFKNAAKLIPLSGQRN
jgi:hypothetical protein